MAFQRILIANRGEIAVRIAHTVREMGCSPVTVYSEADRDAPHVRVCDAAVEIGPAPSRESYLVIDKILGAARTLGAEAIHPGYGFLSEKADFAAACERAGIVFIGPPSKAIAAMGSKTGGRALMKAAGVPITPGTDGAVTGSDEDVLRIAKDIGFPIMLKAVNGGGGKGMRLVRQESEVAAALRMARSEAKNAFNDDAVYLERFVERPRHVEIQVFCDGHGNGVYFGERDCSIQRRNQKIIEESPSTAVDAKLRAQMGQVAVKGALSVGYVGAGTMEFLLDPQGHFYFLEMNTRLQVEHPVTEAVYGVDLVREQIRIAQGEKLGYDQSAIAPRGHAIEVRVYAEDPEANFMPSPGHIGELRFPAGPGVRVDSGVRGNFTVPIHYDPMIAKITCWAADRKGAIARARRALFDTRVAGIKTNIELLDALLAHPAFGAGDVNTGFIEQHRGALGGKLSEPVREAAIIGAVLKKHLQDDVSAMRDSLAAASDSAWLRLGRSAGLRGDFSDEGVSMKYLVVHDGKELEIEVVDLDGARHQVTAFGKTSVVSAHELDHGGVLLEREHELFELCFDADHRVLVRGKQTTVQVLNMREAFQRKLQASQAGSAGHWEVRAPMPGKVVNVLVEVGKEVKAGQGLVVIEAMKMENELRAPEAGFVAEVLVKVGGTVESGQVLVKSGDPRE